MTRPIAPRRAAGTRSDAAVLKRTWRQTQRRFGDDHELRDMTEIQLWSLIRLLVLMLNIRDRPQGERVTHARALGRELGWSQGALMPRLQRLESLGWARSTPQRRVIDGKRTRVQSYVVTSNGEAAAAVMSQHLRELITITPRERRLL